VSELALIQDITPRRVKQLWKAYRRNGMIPALRKAGRPRSKLIGQRDIAIVLEAYDELKIGAMSLEYALKKRYGLNVPHNRIHAILKESGRALPEQAKQRRRKWVRYEREHSMDLWHTDWYELSDGRWWIAYMDDASRLIMAHGVFQEETAENALHVLKRAIAKYGKPREILTDHGPQFYANEGERKEKGISRFEAFLAERGIRHILARVNHPQTNGKLERFYGVYDQKRHQFSSLEEYVHWHNEIKPHLSLNFEELETPILAFYRKLPQEQQVAAPSEARVK